MKQKILAASVQYSRNPETGAVTMLDLMGVRWYVLDATEADYNTFLAENWQFYDVKHDYVIKQVEDV